MHLGVIVNMEDDWRASIEKVRIAEDLGYEMVTCTETWGVSPIPWLTLVAAHTSTIELGPGILNVFSRSPALIAQDDLATLDLISEGRTFLGLGSSGNIVVEHFHGVPFDRPLRRIREYVEVFRALIAGEALDYEGELLQMHGGFHLDITQTRDRIPVYIASITPRSIRQTAEIADGVMPLHWPSSLYGALREGLDAGARAAGRDPSAVAILAPITVHLHDGATADRDRQLEAAREPLWHYINRMGSFYWQMLTRNGYEEEVAASREAWANRDRVGALAAISEQMVRDVQVFGTAEEARAQLRRRAQLGADLQLLDVPPGEVAATGRWLESLLD